MSLFRKDEQTVPCSVSKEFVEFVANQNPEMLKKDGQPIIPAVLFMLGFNIDLAKPTNEYYVVADKIIRTANRPYETYVTTVYSGRVRNEVSQIKDGKLVYAKNTPHFMRPMYEKYEVLTIGEISPELVTNINEIGDILAYNLGMVKSDQRVDPEKKFRQIVR